MPKPSNRNTMPAPKRRYQRGDPVTRVSDAIAAQPTDQREFLSLARSRFKLASEAEHKFREAALDDLRFLVGKQWPAETKQAREATNRPCLTINRLPSIKSQIVNEQRSQRPGIVVKPVGQGADVDTAETIEGMIRHIFVNSDAEVAVDCAFEHMTTGGKGYLEMTRDYVPGMSFDQELYIKRVKNPFTIYCDPSSIEPDETDAEWKFKVCDYPFDEYKQKFSDTTLASLTDLKSVGDNFPGWGDGKTVRVAEYWHKIWTDTELYRMRNGDILTKAQYDIRTRGVSEADKESPIEKRPWRKATIQCDTINAIETIETYIFPGNIGYIPLFPCIGEDFDVNGERELYGFIRNAKDPQRTINYDRSYAVETIQLAPKAPFIGWKGQFTDPKWKTANQVNWAYLEADIKTTSGQDAPSLPQRNNVEPPIQAILQLSMVSDQDLKAVTGIYEPSLGQSKGDQSGKAIDLLQRQGGLTNLNWTDNLSRTLRHVGRAAIDAIPFVYDAPRIQRIIKQGGQPDSVIVHSGRGAAADTLKTDSVQRVFDLSKGSYDVVIDVGPGWKTKQEKAFSLQLQLAEADKSGTILKVASDIIVENSDMPGARQIADRLRRSMPPNLLTDDTGDPKIQLQQAQATNQQLEKQNQELMRQNTVMMQTIKEERISAAKDIQVAEIRKSAQIEAAAIGAKTDALRIEFEKLALFHDSAHERAMAAATGAAGAENTPPPAGPNGTPGAPPTDDTGGTGMEAA